MISNVNYNNINVQNLQIIKMLMHQNEIEYTFKAACEKKKSKHQNALQHGSKTQNNVIILGIVPTRVIFT